MAAYFKFEDTVEQILKGTHDFDTHAFKVYLTNAAPSASLDFGITDLADIAGGNGYTAGGSALTVTVAETAGTAKATVSSDITWTASGGTIGPFRYAVVYNDTATSPADALICSFDYGSAVTLAIGETFTVDFDQTNGLFTLA